MLIHLYSCLRRFVWKPCWLVLMTQDEIILFILLLCFEPALALIFLLTLLF